MNYTLSKVAIFAGGAILGSVVTWQVLKTRCEKRIQEEVAEVKEYYANRAAEGYFDSESKRYAEVGKSLADGFAEGLKGNTESAEPIKPAESSLQGYAQTLKELGYTNYSSKGKVASEEVTDVMKPRVISPEEFDELRDEGYITESLTYYADGVLVDDQNDPIDDVDAIIGKDSLTHFGEYEPDSVFVRNDKLKIDFEILLDLRNFSDITDESLASGK